MAVAKDSVAVAEKWANTKIAENLGDSVSAFAKICGRDWTYYVKDVNINIGRPPDALSRSTTRAASSPPADQTNEATAIQIDLGPSKTISRLHAELFFNRVNAKWHVVVNGRNGMGVNNTTLRRGQQCQVKSGDVLAIAGTQMMFITAEDRADIHPMFLDMIREHAHGVVDSGQWNDQPHAHPETSTSVDHPSTSQTLSMARTHVSGQVAILPAPPDFVRPITPVHSPRRPALSNVGVQQSPAYGRGVVMESDEDIDLSLDVNRSTKPSMSYAVMIVQAIKSTEEEMLTLSGIYNWIRSKFAFYRGGHPGWQACLRSIGSLTVATALTLNRIRSATICR